jgi:hypothetical protein
MSEHIGTAEEWVSTRYIEGENGKKPVVIIDELTVLSGLGKMVRFRQGISAIQPPTSAEVNDWLANGGPERLKELEQKKEQGENND